MNRSEQFENVQCEVILGDGTQRVFTIPLLTSVAAGFRYVKAYCKQHRLANPASIRFNQTGPSPTQVEKDLNRHDQTLEETLRECADLLGRDPD